MIVMKFGGTSVESAAAITAVAGIIASRLSRRPLVVVSAMGKTTNRLLAAADKAAASNLADALRDLEDIRAFHHREAYQVVPPVSHSSLEAVLEKIFSSTASSEEWLTGGTTW